MWGGESGGQHSISSTEAQEGHSTEGQGRSVAARGRRREPIPESISLIHATHTPVGSPSMGGREYHRGYKAVITVYGHTGGEPINGREGGFKFERNETVSTVQY